MPTEQAKFSSPPVFRYLRGYALDPTLALQLNTAPVSQVVFKIPWEKKDLKPGPIGEYLEIIDYDPLSKCFYEAVDLNETNILAQDGLPPSEGTPQFHQQMVYAVAQLTIHNFERALGRRTLWAPRIVDGQAEVQEVFVERLRIYPHALREANAYYSPAKKSLLFGYFLAPESDTEAEHMPGGLVFTCLSHDIIAHETTHALLDGLRRRFNRATNPDMLAFHEAFADLVALFQHFTFPEILKHQIGQTRGALDSQETLLAQLAGQFGRATGMRGALRDAIGKYDPEQKRWIPHDPNPSEYKIVTEPHRRGSILVAAVFDAFLSIYKKRTSDLVRIYTGGTGVLPEGDIHPDLVARLSNEASKTANHVLSMCVRALDYCPPVDLTFGEYLQALITADVDLVPEDDLNYRVAFVEAFRRRGIYPRNLRTLSVENLVWRRPERDEFQPSPELTQLCAGLWFHSLGELLAISREDLFNDLASARRALREELSKLLQAEEEAKQKRLATDKTDCQFLGLAATKEGKFKFEVESIHFANRTGPDGDLLLQGVIQIVQEQIVPEGKFKGQRMEGGCTLIIDFRESKISYCIRKPMSLSRQSRQSAFFQEMSGTTLRDTYFGTADSSERKEPFALLHRAGV
jgi:hypothetical protein